MNEERPPLVENLPTYDQLARGLARIAREKSEWAGIPIYRVGEYRMRLEPRYPYQFESDESDQSDTSDKSDSDLQILNQFWSDRKGCGIVIYRREDGKSDWCQDVASKGALALGTMMVSAAWPLDAEITAMHKLQSLVKDHTFLSYVMTGMFLESSKRSGVTYVFRRLRPTLALKDGNILCALCRHSIGYFEGTFGGALVPTDEVVGNLVWMRGDEHAFWKQSNQHHPIMPQAGI
jgi:hypothetical protein